MNLYFILGLEHILSLDALDHLLFLLVLALPFGMAQIRNLLVLVTGFTFGHTLTLILSSIGYIKTNPYWIELLIPFTIALNCLYVGLCIWKSDTHKPSPLLLLCCLFGCIHGLGFANTLSALLGKEQSLFAPIFWFNMGIEVAQILVLMSLMLVHEGLKKIHPNLYTSFQILGLVVAFLLSVKMIFDRLV